MNAKILNQTHPTRKEKWLAECRALVKGGEGWQHLADTWCPKNVAETTEIYEDRKKRMLYHNNCGPLVSTMSGYLFSSEPVVDGLGEYGKKLTKDADRCGTPLLQWWKEAFLECLIGGRGFVWVNLPNRAAEAGDRLSEEKLGYLDAYLVWISAEELLDWDYDANSQLTWVIFRQRISERDAIDKPRKRGWRWIALTTTTIQTWEWFESDGKTEPSPEDEIAEKSNIEHKVGRLPGVMMELPEPLWAMNLLHDPAIAHLRSRNDFSWSLHKSAIAMMYVKHRHPSNGDLAIGDGYVLMLDPGDDVGWTEPGGSAYSAQREDIRDLLQDLYRVVQQMASAVDNDASRMKSSGESKNADWKALDIVMVAFGGIVKKAMLTALSIVAEIRKDGDPNVTIGGLDTWKPEDLMVWLTAAGLALEAKRLSATFVKAIAKRQVEKILENLPDDVAQAIRDEIDAAPDDEVLPPRPEDDGLDDEPPEQEPKAE